MTVVVKVGGARAVDPGPTVADVAALVEAGEEVVLVHGGSTAVDETLEALGESPEYVETPDGIVGRFTDERTMEVFEMVLPGKLSTDLTVSLRNAGVDAVGLSGVDGGLLTGPRKSAVRVLEDGKRKVRRGDHSGRIESVNVDLLSTLLTAGHTPVVTVPMLGVESGPGPANGTSSDSESSDVRRFLAVNADADRAAAAIAGALGGDLVVLTDVPGVLADPEDRDSLIGRVDSPAGLDDLHEAAEGFMTRKVMAATEALEGGAERVVIASSNAEAPVQSAVEGEGTVILPAAVEADSAPEEDSDEEVKA